MRYHSRNSADNSRLFTQLIYSSRSGRRIPVTSVAAKLGSKSVAATPKSWQLGSIRVLRNAMGRGVGGCKKKRYEGVWFNVIRRYEGMGGANFPEKSVA